jgi:hypothetical protein
MSEENLIFADTFDFEFAIESYGVRVKIQAATRQLLDDAEEVARKALLGRLRPTPSSGANHSFAIDLEDDDTLVLFQNGIRITYDRTRARFFRFFDSLLRITVAEHAENRVFIHAGVVGWKGKAIVIPANSFQGKTTLVRELITRGADYYSDEYAILDEDGLVHAFPRDLSIRYLDGGTRERQVKIEELGAKAGTTPIPIGVVLLTEYIENATWQPEQLTAGQGIMEVIPHTIPRRFNPEFSLKVLNTSVRDAIILKSSRGDAADSAFKILNFIDNLPELAKIT